LGKPRLRQPGVFSSARHVGNVDYAANLAAFDFPEALKDLRTDITRFSSHASSPAQPGIRSSLSSMSHPFRVETPNGSVTQGGAMLALGYYVKRLQR